MGRFDTQSIAVEPEKPGRFDDVSEAVEPQVEPSENEAPFLGFLNRGITTALGAPVDLVNAGLNLIGIGTDVPFLGRESIESGLGLAGTRFPQPGQEPSGIGQRIERGIGETIGSLLPVGAVASGVARGAGAGASAARSLLQGVAKAPVAATGLDVASGALAGTGEQIAVENFPDSTTAEALGALAGGLSPALAAVAGRAVLRLPGPRIVSKAATATFAPFTKAGGRLRAEKRIQDLVSDPDVAARRLDQDETIAELSAAQQTGEPRLLALEREVLDKNVSLEHEFGEQTAKATQTLRDDLLTLGPGSVEDTATFIGQRVARLNNALDLRAQQAAAEAERRIKLLAPERRATESSVIVRDEIEKALASTRAQENVLWGQVPQDLQIPTTKTMASYDSFFSGLSRAQRSDIPDIATRFLTPGNETFGSNETVKEMHGLYSKLREESRIARSNEHFNTARIADGIADSIIDDIDSVPFAGEAFDIARSFSRDLNQRFSQGAVGRILGRERVGGVSVPPELTLQTTVGRSGDRSGVETMQILNAAPAARTELGQFVLNSFEKQTVKGGVFDPKAARKFVKETNLLDNFPGLREDMLAAAEAGEVAARATTRAQTVSKSLRSKNESVAAEFLDSSPGREISRVINSKDPRGTMQQLVRQAGKDKTGAALAGLKSATIDHLIQKSITGSFDDMGQRLLSGRAMKAALGDKATRSAMSQVLTPDEIKRLAKIADELSKIETARGRLPNIGGIISDIPSSILNTMARVLGAQQGRIIAANLGGGTVQTPGILSAKAQNALTSLTNDKAREFLIEAVKSKQLMEALLSPTLKGNKIAARRFNAWLAGPGLRFSESLEENSETVP